MDQSYQRIVWNTERPNGSKDANAIRKFNVSGDYLTIVHVVGSHPAYVRLGDESNPWIQVHSRMVLCRPSPFEAITFAAGGFAGAHPGVATTVWDLSGGHTGPTRVVAYVSYGKLVDTWPPKEYGIRRSPVMVKDLVATTTEQEIVSELIVGGGVLDRAASIGLNGATMLILNTGSTDLYLGVGYPSTPSFPLASGTRGFGPIKPDTSFEILIDDLVFAFPNIAGGGMSVFTLVGTTTFSVMITSGEFNSVEPFQAVGDPQGLA